MKEAPGWLGAFLWGWWGLGLSFHRRQTLLMKRVGRGRGGGEMTTVTLITILILAGKGSCVRRLLEHCTVASGSWAGHIHGLGVSSSVLGLLCTSLFCLSVYVIGPPVNLTTLSVPHVEGAGALACSTRWVRAVRGLVLPAGPDLLAVVDGSPLPSWSCPVSSWVKGCSI